MEPDSLSFDSAIADFYRSTPEESRLEQGAFLLEALRTRELIARFAPDPPACVLDVGGAAGAYAFSIAASGYQVHLLDASPHLVEKALDRNRQATHPLASCCQGDARKLPFPNAFAEVVLLLGPLYHLTEASHRARALAEAARVLKPGGILFAAVISRYASTLDGLARDLFADPDFRTIAEQDLKDGQHRNPTGRLDYFTTAYFHQPETLLNECISAGFEHVEVFGIEGPAWILPDLNERLADERRRDDILRVARQLENEPALLGASAHLLAVTRKTK